MMLLSFLAFSESVSTRINSRKPVDRETIVSRNSIAKRNITLQQARLFLTSLEFFKSLNETSFLYSEQQLAHVMLTEFETYNTRKSSPPEIDQVLKLHAPRRTDLIS